MELILINLIRVIVAITLFEAAYTAEVIRGGLQALPRGQYDAAKSLGYGLLATSLIGNFTSSFEISNTRYC